MRKVITRTIEVVCSRCAGGGAFPLYDDAEQHVGTVMCPDCRGTGTLSSYVNEEVDDGEDEPVDRGVSVLHIL